MPLEDVTIRRDSCLNVRLQISVEKGARVHIAT